MSQAQACACCGKPDRSLSCSRCKTYYCDVECQRKHWGKHKPSCMQAIVTPLMSQPGAVPAEEQRAPPYRPNCNWCQKSCQQIFNCGCRRTVYCSTLCRNSARHDCKVVEGVRAVERRADYGALASAAAAMGQMANNHVLLLPHEPLARLGALAEQLGAVLDGAEQTRQWMMAAFDARGQHQSHMPQSRCEQAISAAFAAVELIHEWLLEFDQTYAAVIASQDVTDQAQLLRVLTALQDPEFTAQFQDAAAPTQVLCELHVNGIRTKIAQHILSSTVAIRQSAITATLVASGDEVTSQTKADCIERLESAQALLSGLNLPGHDQHIRCENRIPRVLTIVLPPALGGGPLRPPVFPVLDMFNLIFSQVVLAIQVYPRGAEDTTLCRWTTFAELVAQPFGEQQGSLLHTLEVLVQRYGTEFRRQISQPGTQLTWERLNASFWREAVRLASLYAGTARVQSIIIDAATILPLAGKHREMGLIFLNWVMYCWRLRSREATVPPLWASCAVMRDGEPGAPASMWTPRQEVDFVLAQTATYLAAAGHSRGCQKLLTAVRQLQADPSWLDRAMPGDEPEPGDEGPRPALPRSESDED